MLRTLIGIVSVAVLAGTVSFVRADSTQTSDKCEYKKCSTPWIAGGGLKEAPAAGEKQRGMYSSVCQTPVNWCVIGPGPIGVSCYCNTYNGPIFGVTVQ